MKVKVGGLYTRHLNQGWEGPLVEDMYGILSKMDTAWSLHMGGMKTIGAYI